MNPEAKLTANFSCAKCRGKTAVTKTVPLTRGLPELFNLSADKYILLTCTLCGYTEMYNASVFAMEREPVEEAKPLPQKFSG